MKQAWPGLLALAAVGAALSACSSSPGKETPHKPIITLVGDSTQTDNQGYGLGFCANLTREVECVNRAKGGASTKTYLRDGYWSKALSPKPDWMLIQFGHNDLQSAAHADRETDIKTEYPANLRNYIARAREQGIHPILVTPISRRYFGPDGKIHSDLTEHSEIVRRIAKEQNVPLIDLQQLSIDKLEQIGEEQGNTLGLTKIVDGKTVPDKTHFNTAGSYVFGRIAAEAMGRAVPELARYVRPEPAVR
ncbi:rhamnogalacturonan acetylesterase [Uliginosibacterium sp. H3]|uniref:Rhamnogalacturonan acetylesterase n=1 Tax=Uliginosibacterium silvisoli TaxID=3114758 RepID=A0ABU6JXM1_9RHOO|nr:rhamnogalacturonan acetylesterase [Uliginosibacterium sp. H3]